MDMDTAIAPNPTLASIFLSDMLSTEQAADLLGVPKRVLAVWRNVRVGPPFVTLRRGAIGYPAAGVRKFLRQREAWKRERQNPRAGKQKRKF